jgi:hypothetical protein
MTGPFLSDVTSLLQLSCDLSEVQMQFNRLSGPLPEAPGIRLNGKQVFANLRTLMLAYNHLTGT